MFDKFNKLNKNLKCSKCSKYTEQHRDLHEIDETVASISEYLEMPPKKNNLNHFLLGQTKNFFVKVCGEWEEKAIN